MTNQDVVSSRSPQPCEPVAGVFERQVAGFSKRYDLRLDQKTLLYWQGFIDGPTSRAFDFKLYDLEDARRTLYSLAEKDFAIRESRERCKKLEELQWQVL